MTQYLLIDSTRLGSPAPEDFTLYFESYFDKSLTNAVLKSVYIVTRLPFPTNNPRHLNIHCSLLTKEDNYINSEKSDVIAILYGGYPRTHGQVKQLGMNFPKAINNSNCIRMYLTDCNDTPLKAGTIASVMYELEFS